jgi:gamma-glutamylcyclotransferase (GGCT)/AIG2-like uncharacterized protein YtfP
MQEPPHHLFVYGSLLRSENHAMGRRLAAEAAFVGAATVPGRLYAVGWYPGLVASTDPSDCVHGEVFRLLAPDATLVWLDAYEGLSAADVRSAEYAREQRLATLTDGSLCAVWVYLYQRTVEESRRVASGRWADHRRR